MKLHRNAKELIETNLANIQALQQAESHIIKSINLISELNYGKKINYDHYNQLLQELYKTEMEQWRKLFMWAITMDDGERDRIKALAYSTFFKKTSSVREHLYSDDHNPSKWLCADEDEFREMAKKLFSPKDEQVG